jgi:acetylornithine deacetylase/succinyl-diaminopimelate desuccinylase-like protein
VGAAWAGDAALDESGRETAELLSRLIQINTTNPPGNETAVAHFLRDYFAAHGVEGEVVGEWPERQNFIARLHGSRPGPTLVVMAHMDVVPCEPEQWSQPPFSGLIKDGYVWGRGADDIKNLVAAETVAFLRLAAAGADFAGTLVLAATADEEVGDQCGARWLVQNRPDLVRCDYLLNEGGGEYVEVAGKRTYMLTVGEKGTAQFKLTFHGETGHASVPPHGRNAVAEMARAIKALVEHEPELRFDCVPELLIERLVGDAGLRSRLLDPAQVRPALAELRAVDVETADLIEPLYGITLVPTIVRAGGEAVNVLASHAEVTVDCRTLPGQTEDDVRREVEAALGGPGGWELEWLGTVAGNDSPVGNDFSRAIDTVIAEAVPGAVVAPMHCVGFTDSNWYRATFPDVVAYGFGPYITEDYLATGPRCHNHDERITVRDVGFQAAFVERLVRELLR